MLPKIIPAIMAGGRGTRLWPLSRATAAKQFLKLIGEETLFQDTLKRVSDAKVYGAPLVITNDEFRFLVAEQARELGVTLSSIVLEPVPRNTAAAVAVAARIVADRFGEDALLLVLPSDHAITVDDTYKKCVRSACIAAAEGKLVTFGIQPTWPATGYGYIERGTYLGKDVHAVQCFVEKPSLEKAAALLETGNYYWNSGMFLFQAASIIAELEEHAPDVLSAVHAAVRGSTVDADFIRLAPESFSQAPSISIDYALMEKNRKTPPWSARILLGRISVVGMLCGRMRSRMLMVTCSRAMLRPATRRIRLCCRIPRISLYRGWMELQSSLARTQSSSGDWRRPMRSETW
ncbi:mannose-1-phosphate guanylyltransferase NoeJ (plasmid) [Sinorhizobium fredii USDA 257]|uniref:Mannose-1-phosphate guanylyltransferase NoeJ n=1 Tax=Sinorhizobium fredii (strain USDA 257) TaxID=1185652 RepID=I3XGN1_SINF2|nr:mannose-1-phosphate guanylyltransferase NoeJ [Sinorhizobium fredii USDA 257]